MNEKKFKLPDNYLEKYNCDFCTKVELSSVGVENLNKYYHNVRGLPGFIDDIIHITGNPPQLNLMRNYPNLVEWSKSGDALLIPNGIYLKHAAPLPELFKQDPQGIALVAWYIHPKQLEQTIFSQEEARNDFGKASSRYSYAALIEPKTRLERYEYKQRIKDIEDQSGIPYLASVLDIKKENLGYLINLKQMIIRHLEKNYRVSDEDYIHTFFHKIISEKHTTLHLHVRINQGVHPLEGKKRLTLDEAINVLESGKDIKNNLLDEKYCYMEDVRGYLANMNGIKLTRIKNEFKVDSNLVNPTEGVLFKDFKRTNFSQTNSSQIENHIATQPSLSLLQQRHQR